MWNEIPKRNPDFKKELKRVKDYCMVSMVHMTWNMQYYYIYITSIYITKISENKKKCRPFNICKGGDIKYITGTE